MHKYTFQIVTLLFLSIIFSDECMDAQACNYNPYSEIDDGSCFYPIECPDNTSACNINDCLEPINFQWNQSNKILFLFVDYAYKFNANYPLVEQEDWIGGFKSYDETKDGLCDTISDNCPDINEDGLLTENIEICVGSKYWNGNNNSELPLMGFEINNSLTNGYLEPGDKPYFKLFEAQSDSVFYMQPYKNGDEYEVTYAGNSAIEIIEIDSLVAQCPFYNNLDTDNDNIPDTCDICPNDNNNDIDGDGICGNIDSCPNDSENDIDGDGICGDIDTCPNDALNDSDNDGICFSQDICPNSFYNIDNDQDGVCDTEDECIGEYDVCGICNGDGTWCLSSEISIGIVTELFIEVLYDSPLDIGGFQFNLSGVNIVSTTGGAVEDSNFHIATNNNTVLGFSFNGDSIPAGSGVLTNIFIEIDGPEICISNMILSDNDGDEITIENDSVCNYLPCIDIDNDSLCNYEDNCPNDNNNDVDGDGICGDIDSCPNDSDNDIDGDGICGDIDSCPNDSDNDIDGDGICGDIDSCPNDSDNDIDGDGICSDIDSCPNDSDNDIDGDGICGDVDSYPNCYSNFYDCLGNCGGEAVLDSCNQCDGNNYDQCDNDNDGIINIDDICPNDNNNDIDGDGICGDVDSYPNCYSNFYDCLGNCGGKAIIDECGTCNGTGNCTCPGYPDGVIQDCNGVCDGTAIIDECGICNGSNIEQDCAGDCFGSAIIDDCGICNGDNLDKDCFGECFGTAIIDECGICNGSNIEQDCAGDCFGTAIIDDCGICNGDNLDKDCFGECFGTAIIDECGICNGANIEQDCAGDCFGTAIIDDCGICSEGNSGHSYNSDIDCNGECFGSGIDIDNDLLCDDIDECIGEFDDCGICNGDGTWCLNANIYFGDYHQGHLSVMYDSPLDIGGYQITVSGFNILNGFGGSSASSGFNIANNENTIIGFSLTGQSIPAGQGVLLVLNIEQVNPNFCYSSIIISDNNGDEINTTVGSCLDIPCPDMDNDTLCDSIDTCFGILDECGVCNGLNDSCLGCLDPLACNYDSNALINNNSCFYNEGSCDCNGEPVENYCNCNFQDNDCWGDCGGSAYLDYCGDCVSGNSPYEEGFLDLGCSCHNPAPLLYCEDSDSDGLGNIETENYYCLEFDINNLYPTLPANWVQDCSDLCPDDIENDFDQDGVCEADEVYGCNEITACNYSYDATEDDDSCIYLSFSNLLPENSNVFLTNDACECEEILFSWSPPSDECDNINYKLTIFDNFLNPIIIRFTNDYSLNISISDLDIDESIINNYNWNITGSNNDGLEYESELFSFFIDPTFLNITNDIPNTFFLSDPFPNPFNPSTSITYGIPVYSQVSINIYNSLGQKIYSLGKKYYQPGTYSFIWNPINIASGIYYVQLVSDEILLNKKVISIK